MITGRKEGRKGGRKGGKEKEVKLSPFLGDMIMIIYF